LSIVFRLIKQQNLDDPNSGVLIGDAIILRMFIVGSVGGGGGSSEGGASGSW
jgi:hypothetical protein